MVLQDDPHVFAAISATNGVWTAHGDIQKILENIDPTVWWAGQLVLQSGTTGEDNSYYYNNK